VAWDFRAKQGQNDQVLKLHILWEVHIILFQNFNYKRHPPLLILLIGFSQANIEHLRALFFREKPSQV